MGYPVDESAFAEKVRHELEAARRKHAQGILTPHEAYAVILEELDEAWDVIRAKWTPESPLRLVEELVQIAAMCQRAAEDLQLPVNCVLHEHRFASELHFAEARLNAIAEWKGVKTRDRRATDGAMPPVDRRPAPKPAPPLSWRLP